MRIHNFIQKKPYLVWHTKDLRHLSEEAIVESVLNYGEFQDVQKMIAILGMEKVASIFRKQIKQNRTNYEPKIVNYFTLYFQKHA